MGGTPTNPRRWLVRVAPPYPELCAWASKGVMSKAEEKMLSMKRESAPVIFVGGAAMRHGALPPWPSYRVRAISIIEGCM